MAKTWSERDRAGGNTPALACARCGRRFTKARPAPARCQRCLRELAEIVRRLGALEAGRALLEMAKEVASDE